MGKYNLTKLQSKFRKETMNYDYNSYEDMQKMSEIPIIGNIAKARMNTLAYEENQRYWNDYKRNTGINPRYPIRSGVYGNYSSQIGETFEATEAVMSLYGKWKRRR